MSNPIPKTPQWSKGLFQLSSKITGAPVRYILKLTFHGQKSGRIESTRDIKSLTKGESLHWDFVDEKQEERMERTCHVTFLCPSVMFHNNGDN